MVVSADHLFQGVAEDEQKRKITKQVLPTRMNEQGSNEGPDASSIQIVETKNQILIGPFGILLPSIETCQNAGQHQKPVYPHELWNPNRETAGDGYFRSI